MTPLLRELIVASLTLAESYAPGSRDERIYELILDEIRGMAVLPFGLPEPQSEALRRLCQKVREAPGEPWSSAEAAKESSMSERTLNRHFQQQTSLTWSEWVRRAKLMEALVRLAQGHSVLRVALDLGYGSHSAFSAMFRRVIGVAPATTSARRRNGLRSSHCTTPAARRAPRRYQFLPPAAVAIREDAANIGH